MTYIVDTHALVWFLTGNTALKQHARSVLVNPSSHLVIPTIVLAEINFLFAKKRIVVDASAVLAHINGTQNCVLHPLDETVVERLPTVLNIHDAIIVATALVYRDVLGEPTAVITKDGEIVASKIIDVIF